MKQKGTRVSLGLFGQKKKILHQVIQGQKFRTFQEITPHFHLPLLRDPVLERMSHGQDRAVSKAEVFNGQENAEALEHPEFRRKRRKGMPKLNTYLFSMQ